MLRIFLLSILIIVIIITILGGVFYFKNQESPNSMIIKLITPMLVGVIWLVTTVFEFDKNKKEFFEGSIVVSSKNIPFRFYELDMDSKLYIQNNLPIPYGKSDKQLERIIVGGIWTTIEKISGPSWYGQKSILNEFNNSSMYISVPEGIENFDVSLRKKLMQLKLMKRDSNGGNPYNIGFPKGTSILDDDINEIFFKTPEITFKIKITLTGSSSLTQSGKNKGNAEHELIKYAINTNQTDNSGFYSGMSAERFSIEIVRDVNWWYQWTTSTKRQLEWTDQLIEGFNQYIMFNNYRDEFFKDIYDVNNRDVKETIIAPNRLSFYNPKDRYINFEEKAKKTVIDILGSHLEVDFEEITDGCIKVSLNEFEHHVFFSLTGIMGLVSDNMNSDDRIFLREWKCD